MHQTAHIFCISIKVDKTEPNHEVQLHIKTQYHPSNNMIELAHRAFDLFMRCVIYSVTVTGPYFACTTVRSCGIINM